jgi:ArsR family transcriptional regulator
MPSDEELQRLAGLFGLLADPTRLRIIGALTSGEELCVCDVSHVLGLSLSATSHQLRKLREAGCVTFRNDGRMAYYRLRDDFLAGLMAQGRLQMARPVP